MTNCETSKSHAPRHSTSLQFLHQLSFSPFTPHFHIVTSLSYSLLAHAFYNPLITRQDHPIFIFIEAE
ncbi:unnamed protein product [Lathyrus sativus]|nr:unnamed protein product [Lathyrus sativus]